MSQLIQLEHIVEHEDIRAVCAVCGNKDQTGFLKSHKEKDHRCVLHQAEAIWASLTPVLEELVVTGVTDINFVSDSTVAQYR